MRERERYKTEKEKELGQREKKKKPILFSPAKIIINFKEKQNSGGDHFYTDFNIILKKLSKIKIIFCELCVSHFSFSHVKQCTC